MRFREHSVIGAKRALYLATSLAILGSVLTGCHGGVHAVPLITGLEYPASFTVGPDNESIWYSERFSGEIRRRNLSTNADTLVWRVSDIATGQEQGLFGLALHPGYPSAPYLYAFATRVTGFGVINQILRITLNGSGVGTSAQVLLGDPYADANNNGGRIEFGSDGMLYGSFGAHSVQSNAQNLGNLAGKVFRMTPTGGVPAGNPFAGSHIWAYGIRNAFGFDFDPGNGRLWLVDNGPECNDEVNLITKGGNYAWGPNATCGPPGAPTNTNLDGPEPRLLPKWYQATPSIGPTGAAFCEGCGLGSATEGTLLFGTANEGHIYRLVLNSTRDGIVSDSIILDHTGPVLSIETRAGQPIYFSDTGAIYKLSLTG